MDYLKEPHTALFTGQTGCGKTERALRLIETEYINHFEFIIIISPTIKYNETYRKRAWILTDERVTLLEPAGKLYEYLEGFGKLLAGCETLFIVDDIIADDCLDKRRNSLLELAISGRHRYHSLWFLTQSYTAVPKNIRRQVKMLYVWKPKNRNDLFTIYEENDIINSREDLEKIKKELKCEKYNCLVLRSEHPESYHIITK